VRVQEVTPELREAMKLETERGALVSDVMKSSPAAHAGIEKGDLIVAIDGRTVETPTNVMDWVGAKGAGDQIRLTIVRDGREISSDVKLESRPPARERRRLFPPLPPREREMRGGGHLGVETQQMDDDLAAYFGTSGGRGVLVTGILADSPADDAGLHAGDVILEVDGKAVGSPAELLSAVREKSSGDQVQLLVLRQRRESEMTATLDDAPPFSGSRSPWFDSLRGSMRGLQKKWQAERSARGEEMRREMDDLRKQLDQLREELNELRAKLDG
jgi:serine protease Do